MSKFQKIVVNLVEYYLLSELYVIIYINEED